METQFYEDSNPWLNKKKSMTLDLDTGKTRKSILSTPDVQMLKLASPELEKMIINQQGNVCTTPTPTQFICPKNVTEEQAAFAQGFVEALQSLHSSIPGMQGPVATSVPANLTTDSQTGQTYTQVSVVQTLPQVQAPPNTVVTSGSHFNQALQTTTTLPGTTVNYQPRNSAIATTVDTNGFAAERHLGTYFPVVPPSNKNILLCQLLLSNHKLFLYFMVHHQCPRLTWKPKKESRLNARS